jgi:disulfide bond formation protein DsbB
MTEILDNLLPIGALMGQVLILFLAIIYFTPSKKMIFKFFGKYGATLAFLVALASMLGSLYYSEIVGFEPCILCWYQRIFMYPSVFILAFAIYKKDKFAIPYVLILSYIGGALAFYHSIIQARKVESVVCEIGEQASCSESYITSFNYITIPVISLTAFALMIVFLHLSYKYHEQRENK